MEQRTYLRAITSFQAFSPPYPNDQASSISLLPGRTEARVPSPAVSIVLETAFYILHIWKIKGKDLSLPFEFRQLGSTRRSHFCREVAIF
jgi:hypothetical protein